MRRVIFETFLLCIKEYTLHFPLFIANMIFLPNFKTLFLLLKFNFKIMLTK